MVEFVFDQVFDASLYPELSDPQLAALIQSKIASMQLFMDKMKGGVRQMRSSVTYNGVQYWFLYKR